MKRNEMIAVIADGGSVLHNGRLIWSVENLPSHAELAHSEEEKAAAADDLDKQIADLLKKREALGGKTGEPSSGNSGAAVAEIGGADVFPEGFPARARAVFEKLGKTYADVQKMERKELIEINGIAETTADEVLAFGKK